MHEKHLSLRCFKSGQNSGFRFGISSTEPLPEFIEAAWMDKQCDRFELFELQNAHRTLNVDLQNNPFTLFKARGNLIAERSIPTS